MSTRLNIQGQFKIRSQKVAIIQARSQADALGAFAPSAGPIAPSDTSLRDAKAAPLRDNWGACEVDSIYATSIGMLNVKY